MVNSQLHSLFTTHHSPEQPYETSHLLLILWYILMSLSDLYDQGELPISVIERPGFWIWVRLWWAYFWRSILINLALGITLLLAVEPLKQFFGVMVVGIFLLVSMLGIALYANYLISTWMIDKKFGLLRMVILTREFQRISAFEKVKNAKIFSRWHTKLFFIFCLIDVLIGYFENQVEVEPLASMLTVFSTLMNLAYSIIEVLIMQYIMGKNMGSYRLVFVEQSAYVLDQQSTIINSNGQR